MKTFLLSVVLAIFVATPCFAQDTASIADELAKTAWKDVRAKGSGWQYRVSPPFPATWPSSKDAPVVFYVYATKFNPMRIMDGVHVAAPWAEIQVDPTNASPPKVTIKKKKLVDIGIQGVRPLKKEEINSQCAWIKNNSVIAKQIEPLQQSFFASLECK